MEKIPYALPGNCFSSFLHATIIRAIQVLMRNADDSQRLFRRGRGEGPSSVVSYPLLQHLIWLRQLRLASRWPASKHCTGHWDQDPPRAAIVFFPSVKTAEEMDTPYTMSRESPSLGEEKMRRRILYARSCQKDPLSAHESTMPRNQGGTKTVPSAPIQYVVMTLMATSKHTFAPVRRV